MKDIFNKRQRFSIRKFSVGVASVLIGVALFTPSQGVLASTENNLATEIGTNSERENSIPTVRKNKSLKVHQRIKVISPVQPQKILQSNLQGLQKSVRLGIRKIIA